MFAAHVCAFVLVTMSKAFDMMKCNGGYVKVVLINLGNLTYIVCLMYLIFSFMRTYHLLNAVDPDVPEPARDCLIGQPSNKPLYLNAHEFRLMELTLFFVQTISLSAYICLCKLFIVIKRAVSTEEQLAVLERKDPFWSLLNKGVADFFAYDNMVMAITTVQITNMLLSLYGSIYIYDTNDQMLDFKIFMCTVCVPFNGVLFILWLSFVWNGSDLANLFSKNKVGAITFLAVINTVTMLLMSRFSSALKKTDDESPRDRRFYTLFLFCFN